MNPGRGGTARTYDRIAPFYDWFEAPMDLLGGNARRRRILEDVRGRVLEVGVGTGRNLPLYPRGARITGIDVSKGMLERARRRATDAAAEVELREADAHALPFEDDSFDVATATCVFCSVDDPVRGLREVARVVRPDGEVRLLEHVRPRSPILAGLFDLLSPVVRRIFGPEINRRTEANVEAAGLLVTEIRRDGIWREIVARPLSPGAPGTGPGP